jgi:triphosphatase
MAKAAEHKVRANSRLTRKADVEAAFRQFIAASDEALVRLEREAGHSDAESIHRFRTTIRRLRSLLSSFKDLLPNDQRKELSRQLKEFAQHYAHLREWDVFLQATKKPREAGLTGSMWLKPVEAAALAARGAELTKNGRLATDIEAIDRTLAGTKWLRAPKSGQRAGWNRKFAKFAPSVLDEQRRKLRKQAKRLDLADSAAVHKFRINTKKHRYMIEFASYLYKKKSAKRYLGRLVAIQDVLGEMRDALKAQELVTRLEVPEPSRALVTGWLAHDVTTCRELFPSYGKAFRDADPFWE